MLANGLYLIADRAVSAFGAPLAERYRKTLILGALREDVLYVPLLGRVTEYPSFSHFYRPGVPGGFLPLLWPGPRLSADRLYRRALAAHAEGKTAAAFVLLGRIVHLLADMSIPSHTARAAHDRDPFEWWVEGNLDALAALPVPEVARAAAASDLIENLARTSMTFTPDHTNHPWGRFLARRGLRKGVTAREAGEQARVLVPLTAGYAAALLGMFFRDRGLAVEAS
ncbi:MAG: hypothetical protein U0359_05565 [Byssovorax sp.]